MPTATDPTTTDQAPPPPAAEAPVPSARTRWAILAVLVVLLLAAVGTILWPRVTGSDDDSSSLVSERESAMALAQKFMVTVNTYGPDMLGKDGKTMPSYRAAVEKMLTAKYATQFEQGVVYAEATVAGNSVGRTSKVFQTGVAAIDDDTATVLVAGEIAVTVPQQTAAKGKQTSAKGAAKGTAKRVVAAREPFRVEVDLTKVHGDWKVDNWGSAEPVSSGASGSGVAQ